MICIRPIAPLGDRARASPLLSAASTAIQNNGGSMDSMQYQFVITSTTQNYQIVGGALAILSGLGALLGMNHVFRRKCELEK